MYKEILSSIESIEIYPIISLAIFFTFFIFLLFQVWRSDKSLMRQLSGLPLDLNQDESPVNINDKEKTSLKHD